MIHRKSVLLALVMITAAGGLMPVRLYSKTTNRSEAVATATALPAQQPPAQDPRFDFPVAPTTMTTEAHNRLAASAAKYTVEAAMPEPGTKRQPAEQQKLEELAARLEKLAPVPDQRRAHFAWLEKADSPVRLNSWVCLLQDAKPIPGGWAVQLIVMARGTGA